MTSKGRKLGYTLLEVLIVIALIGLLLALLLPAIQQTRARAVDVTCASRLRSLAIAANSYEAAHDCFPTALLNPASHFAFILPYLEQNALYEAINFENPYANGTIHATSVSCFVCPNHIVIPEPYREPTPGRATPNSLGGRCSYAGNLGSGRWTSAKTGDGIFSYGRMVRRSDVPDGDSKTAMYSEWVLIENYGNGDPNGNGRVFRVDQTDSQNGFINRCKSIPVNEFGGGPLLGRSWIGGGRAANAYTHLLGPNERGCENMMLVAPMQNAYTVGSRHGAGVHVAFVDGSVHWIASAIDLEIWRSIGSRNDGVGF